MPLAVVSPCLTEEEIKQLALESPIVVAYYMAALVENERRLRATVIAAGLGEPALLDMRSPVAVSYRPRAVERSS